MVNNQLQDGKTRKRRRKYKLYGEPGHENLTAPRASVYRYERQQDLVPTAERVKPFDGSGTSRDEQSDPREAPEVQNIDSDVCLATGKQREQGETSQFDKPGGSNEGNSSQHSSSASIGEQQSDMFKRDEIGSSDEYSDSEVSDVKRTSSHHMCTLNRERQPAHSSILSDECCNEELHMSQNFSEDSSGGEQFQLDEGHNQQEEISTRVHILSSTHSGAKPGQSENTDISSSVVSRSPAVSPASNIEIEDDHEDSSSSTSDEDEHPIDERESDLNDSDDEPEEQPSPLPSPRRPPPPPEDQSPPSSPQHPPEEPPQPDQPHPGPSHQRLRTHLAGKFSERIQDRVIASTGEVLLNIQEFCKRHPLPLTAQEDLHKLINSMFYKEVIPQSTYKLDRLYGTGGEQAHYFFYCSKCFENFGELNNKIVKEKICPLCGTNNIIHDLTKARYLVLIDFVKQLELLLEDREIASQLKNPNEFPDNGDVLEDLYDGLIYKKIVDSLDFRDGMFYLSLTACTDGTPIFKTVTFSIWPIFVIINELPKHTRMNNVLLAGLWFGKQHPKMDLFLEPFCNYIRKLSTVGFTLNVLGEARLYFAYLIAMCVDSGARGSIQCIHSHNGAYPCNWCLHPGETEGDGSSAIKFPQTAIQPEERTQEQIIRDGLAVLRLPGNHNHVNGVTGISPLLRCPKFDIVHGMVLDNLHWASFGVARRMGTLWLGETKKKKKEEEY